TSHSETRPADGEGAGYGVWSCWGSCCRAVSVAVDAKARPSRYGSKPPVNAPLKLITSQRALEPRGGHIDTGAYHGSNREDGAPRDRSGAYRSRAGTRWGCYP